MKTETKITGNVIRSAAATILFSRTCVGFTWALPSKRRVLSSGSPSDMVKPATRTKTLSFADRFGPLFHDPLMRDTNWCSELS
jgi:hypothetical protein